MKEIHGLPNEDRTEIIKHHQDGTNKWLTVPGIDRPVINATPEQYLLAGWVLYVVPVIGENQYQGTLVITDKEYTYQVIDKTIEEVESEKINIMTIAVQNHLDTTAQSKGYDNIVNACGYAAADNPFQSESLAFVSWRGNVWAYSFQVLTDVKADDRDEPTIVELISELPDFGDFY